MSQEHNMRRVTAIRNGTVIDHIPAGQAMRVLEMLGINKGNSASLFLTFSCNVKCKCCFSRRLWAINFNNSSFRQSTNT